MFAAAAPSPDAATAWQVVLTLGVLLTLLANAVIIIRTGRAQKREVSFGFEPAGKVELEKHIEWNRREHENLFSKIGGVERGLTARCDTKHADLEKEQRSSLTRIHSRIDDVLVAVSELKGRQDETSRHTR